MDVIHVLDRYLWEVDSDLLLARDVMPSLLPALSALR
jgi:hypothetical protein